MNEKLSRLLAEKYPIGNSKSTIRPPLAGSRQSPVSDCVEAQPLLTRGLLS